MSKRIPFNIKYRPQIESGEYKVETRDGNRARIICWDREDNANQPLVALIKGRDKESVIYTKINGEYLGTYGHGCDLFIVTPEKEKLTPFEVAVKSWMGVAEDIVIDDSWVKNCAQELLSLAREEFAKEYKGGSEANEKTTSAYCSGYEAGKAKALDDLDGTGKVHCKSYDKGYDCGKKEALKDLPRWMDIRNFQFAWKSQEETFYDRNLGQLFHKGKKLFISDLEKLPGFKEDEK